MIKFFTCPECQCVVSQPGEVCHRCQSKAESSFIVRVCGWSLLTVLAIGVAASSCRGADVATLAWLAQRESSNNPKAVGKCQELGLFQIRDVAVREVNRLKSTHYKHADALDPIKAAKIASHYWDICATRAKVKTREGIWRRYRGFK